jgi:predicted RNA binding protein YcfA (HicA-like mRNA interferase family)
MSPQKREVLNLLRNAGAMLAREKRHLIFRFPDGRIWVVPKTPSDAHAWRNNLSGLRRRLNLRTAARA